MNSVVERSESFFPFDPEEAISNSLQVKELLVLRRKVPPELRPSFCKSIPNIIKVFASYSKTHQLADDDGSCLRSQFAAANAEVAPLRRINANVINILISMLFPANSVQAIEQRIQSLIRTCKIYDISPETPVFTSSEGLNGPTLLVSYKEPRGHGVRLRVHVEKWTTPRETTGQLLYQNLIRFMNQGEVFTWVMPENYWFDFKRQRMESAYSSIEMSKESEWVCCITPIEQAA